MAAASNYGYGNRCDHRQQNRRHRQPEAPVDRQEVYSGLLPRPEMSWSVDSLADVISESGDNPVVITNRGVVASYNWDELSRRPKIVVPGAPREFHEWAGGDLSRSVNELIMSANIHQHHTPLKVLEAMFTAVRVCQPDFKLSNYNLATDAKALGSLFRIASEVVCKIREQRQMQPLPTFQGRSRQGQLVRINALVMGETIVLVRLKTAGSTQNAGSVQSVSKLPAGAVGLAFQRSCRKAPPASMMRPSHDPEDVSIMEEGCFEMVYGIQLGTIKALMCGRFQAAKYPAPEDFRVDSDRVFTNPDVPRVTVVIGGFAGDPSTLTPVTLSSLSSQPSYILKPGKWLSHHLRGNTPLYFVGRHWNFMFSDPPSFKSTAEIREMCGLDEMAAIYWVKALHHILNEIVAFASQYHPDQQLRTFAIISDPENGRLDIHGFERGTNTDIEAVSPETLQYLVSTL